MSDPSQLSPRALGEAIGVSQSSLKRWADRGLLEVHRTAGGHRRIEVREALRFIREAGFTVIRPELLGLEGAELAASLEEGLDSAVDRFRRALTAGDEDIARSVILGLFAEGRPLSLIFDEVFRPALAAIGLLWLDDPHGITIEHRATDICAHVIGDLRGRIAPKEGRRIAIGGAPSGDPYHLPSAMIATALAAEGYRPMNLGPNFPVHGLAEAAAREEARLVWLSVTAAPAVGELRDGILDLVDQLHPREIPVIAGGAALGALELPELAGLHVGRSMADLVAIAREIGAAGSGDLAHRA